MCDLGVTIEGTDLEARIAQLNTEMDARGLTFRPYYWLSDEWFTPDGVPGIAIPFYLAHPRLAQARARADARSRRRRSRSVPRGSCGTRRGTPSTTPTRCGGGRRRRRLFGNPAIEYPEYCTPKPYSKSFVQHLDHWYAQSHPDEDFAETFAVWLDPNVACGRARYAGWPAQRKLEYMDRLMRELAQRRPRVSSKRQMDPLPRLKKTLGEHYRKKREHYGLDHPDFYDSDLLQPVLGRARVRRRTRPRRASSRSIRTGSAQHRRQLHRQLSVHDRSADRGGSSIAAAS